MYAMYLYQDQVQKAVTVVVASIHLYKYYCYYSVTKRLQNIHRNVISYNLRLC